MLNDLSLRYAGWAMGPVEPMAPDGLKAVLQQPLSANESLVSPVAVMFSLGLLLKALASGHLSLAYSKQPSCTLSPETAVEWARDIAGQDRQCQVCLASLFSCLRLFNRASA